jgi:hypothetical protein
LFIRLAYVSVSQVDSDTIESTMSEILDQSYRHNTQDGVTGALLYAGGYFAQLLEGDDIGVETTFMRIQADSRHRDVKVLLHEPCENRYLPSYPMGLAGIDLRAYPEIVGATENVGEISANAAGRAVIELLLRKVRARH